jgi:hypothetical protein
MTVTKRYLTWFVKLNPRLLRLQKDWNRNDLHMAKDHETSEIHLSVTAWWKDPSLQCGTQAQKGHLANLDEGDWQGLFLTISAQSSYLPQLLPNSSLHCPFFWTPLCRAQTPILTCCCTFTEHWTAGTLLLSPTVQRSLLPGAVGSLERYSWDWRKAPCFLSLRLADLGSNITTYPPVYVPSSGSPEGYRGSCAASSTVSAFWSTLLSPLGGDFSVLANHFTWYPSMPVTSISTLQTHDSLSSYPFNVTNTLTQAMTKPSNSFLVTGKLLLQRVRYFCHYSAKAATQTT